MENAKAASTPQEDPDSVRSRPKSASSVQPPAAAADPAAADPTAAAAAGTPK